ncbi:hypothetical protein MAL1_00194 [Bacteriophage DSS3_MAL1]|nr:hypothetical protein MAL1_00194 [Bacteriophage DSS3_MAL1]
MWIAFAVIYAFLFLLMIGLCRAAAIGDAKSERAYEEWKREVDAARATVSAARAA